PTGAAPARRPAPGAVFRHPRRPDRKRIAASVRRAMTAAASFPRLVGDVGGTHARFGIVLDAAGPVQSVARYRCDQFATLWDGLRHYLAEHAPAQPRACALGVATPITGDRVELTNNAWSFSIH